MLGSAVFVVNVFLLITEAHSSFSSPAWIASFFHPQHWFAQAAPVRSLRLLVLVMAAPAAALEEELAAMEAADAADLAAAPAAEAAHPAGAPAAEAAHPAAAAPAVAEAARAAKAPAGPPDVAPLIEDYNEAAWR